MGRVTPEPPGQGVSASPGRAPADGVGLALAVAVGAALRFASLDAHGLWVDEANTVLIALDRLTALPDRLINDSSPPLYYLLLGGWLRLFGVSELAARALPALIGVLLIIAVHRAARSWSGPDVATWAAWLIAVAPAAVFHARESRMYSLLALLSLIAVASIAGGLRDARPGRRRAIVIVGFVAAAMLTHNFGLYVIPVGATLLLLNAGRAARRVSIALVAAVLVWLPWSPVFLTQLTAPDTYSWFAERFERWSAATPLWATVLSFAPNGAYLEFGGWTRATLLGVPALGHLALAMLGVATVMRRGDRRVAAWPILLVVVPATLAVVASHLVTPHYVPGRVDQLFHPAYLILVATGLAAIPWRSLRLALGGASLVLSLVTCLDFVRPPIDERDGRALAETIVEHRRDGEPVVVTSLSRAPIEVYLIARDLPTTGLHSYPASTAAHLGGQDDAALLADPAALKREARELLDRLSGLTSFLLVLVQEPVNEPLVEVIATRDDARYVEDLGRFRLRGTTSGVALVRYRISR